MKTVGVRHNDMFKRNEWEVMVRDDRLYIVDFSWATVNGSFSCEAGIRNAYPPGLSNFKDEHIIDALAGALGVTRVRRLKRCTLSDPGKCRKNNPDAGEKIWYLNDSY